MYCDKDWNSLWTMLEIILDNLNSIFIVYEDLFSQITAVLYCSWQNIFLSFVGVCSCTGSYTGADCSIDSSAVPIVHFLETVVCDTSAADCVNVIVYGSGFTSDNSITCHLEDAEVNYLWIICELFVNLACLDTIQLVWCPVIYSTVLGNRILWTIRNFATVYPRAPKNCFQRNQLKILGREHAK